MLPLGTLVNVAAVVVGSLAGLALKAGVPERVKGIIFSGIGLVTLVIGMLNAFSVAKPVPSADSAGVHLMELIFAVLIGSVIGELIGIEAWLERLGDRLKAKVKGGGERFTEGMVTAFLIFCVGPMTVVGSLSEGISGDASLLYAKSILDLFMGAALASTLGIGVLFSIIPLFVFQYAITLLGHFSGGAAPEFVVNQLTATGGVLILGLGLNILELKKVRVANMLPALVVIVVLALVFG